MAAGYVTRHDLKSRYEPVTRGIYVWKGTELTPNQRVRAFALVAKDGSVIAGIAAACLHGERWISPDAVRESIDVYSQVKRRPRQGVQWRCVSGRLTGDQVDEIDDVAVTSVARTAVDILRWTGNDVDAIAAVDSLCNSTRTPVSAVRDAADSMTLLKGLDRARGLLTKCDSRADSPPETRLRLFLAEAPLPTPEPQLVIRDEWGVIITTADFGYEEAKVAIFYDGEVHLTKRQRDRDYAINAELASRGWRVVRVNSAMVLNRDSLIAHIADALRRQDVQGV